MPETSILTNHQKQLFGEFLKLASDREKTFNLTELQGYLFGLVIVPDMIMPNGWIAEIFGGKMPEFTLEQLEVFLKTLFDAYNTYNNAFHKKDFISPLLIFRLIICQKSL